ncbi:MAG: SDR family oxidoreductase [Nitrospinota bacterium]
MAAALVTGGALRLGRAIATGLARQGFDIALHYNRSTNAADETVAAIKKLGVQCTGFSCDFNKLSCLPDFLKTVKTTHEDLELLINSASLFLPENIENTPDDILVKTMNINLMTPFVLMREFKKRVSKGQIINITDQRILRHGHSYSAYAVSKAALSHLTVLGAVEFGPEVRVNAIAPGLILPDVNKNDVEFFKKRAKSIPLRKNGSTDAILLGVEYLLKNDFVTGETLFIDGGESK